MMLANYGESNQQLVPEICPQGIKKVTASMDGQLKGKQLRENAWNEKTNRLIASMIYLWWDLKLSLLYDAIKKLIIWRTNCANKYFRLTECGWR